MSDRFVVDAHALVWFITGSPRLGPLAKAAMEDASSSLIVPAIALAEACWLTQKGRINISSVDLVLGQISADARFRVDPLDYDLVERCWRLGWNGEMHDQMIIATALRAKAPVLTVDTAIRGSRLVKTIW